MGEAQRFERGCYMGDRGREESAGKWVRRGD